MKKELIKNFAELSFRIVTFIVLVVTILFGAYGLFRYLFTGVI